MAERVDGFLMLLQSCSTEPADHAQLARLMAELREFRNWLQQGRYATQLIDTLSEGAAMTRRKAPQR